MTTSPSNPSFTDCAGKPHRTSLEHNPGTSQSLGTTPSGLGTCGSPLTRRTASRIGHRNRAGPGATDVTAKIRAG